MATPKCPYFGQCGGCSSQHLDYPLQLEGKKKALASYIKFNDIKVFSGDEYGYRNRMDFIFHKDGLGFREKEHWDRLVDVEACPIAEPRINELLTELRKEFKDPDYFDIKTNSGTFRYAVIRTSQDCATISFVLNHDSPRLSEALEKIKQFSSKTSADNVVVAYVAPEKDLSISPNYLVIKGDERLLEAYLGNSFIYSSQGFFQNNHAMAEQLQAYVHRLLKNYDTKDAHLLDLYGGVGTFGIINSRHFKHVTMVESVKECIDACNSNIEMNRVTNVQAILLDASQLKSLRLSADLYVITDPPRSGMHPETIAQISRLKPKAIIYVSCNPMQLAKELPRLKHYRIASAALFDLFPQTPHSEAVVELVKIPDLE